MSSYYVRIKPQLNGTNAIHKDDCPFLPSIENRIYLGEFNNCHDAVRKAEMYFPQASGCSFCLTEHTYTREKVIHDWGVTFYVNVFTIQIT